MDVISNNATQGGEKLMDKELQCLDCGAKFYWTKGEQDFYNAKGFSAPKRCQNCRSKKKANFDKDKGGNNRDR